MPAVRRLSCFPFSTLGETTFVSFFIISVHCFADVPENLVRAALAHSIDRTKRH